MNSLSSHGPGEIQDSLLRTILPYSSAMVFCRLIAIVQGLVIIRLLDPEILGVWLGLQLIHIYGVHAHFGLLNAVNRQIPFHRGRDDLVGARNVEDVARGNLIILSGLGLCVLIVLYLFGLSGTMTGRGALVLILATVTNINVQFYMGLFRARREFGRASMANVINALVILFGLPLVYYYGFNGLLWRAIAAAVITYISCIAIDGFSFRIRYDWQETLGLIRVGLPIMILSYGIVAFASMDRTLILLFLDRKAMGEYALCFAVATVVALFPNLIGQIFYPRMTELFAVSGISRSLLKLCVQASIISAAVAGVVCIVSYVALPMLVHMAFPKYVAGLPALSVALIAYFLLSFGAGPNYFLISTVQKRRQMLVLLASAGTMIMFASFVADRNLIGIAWSLVIGVGAYVAGLWTVVLASMRTTSAAAAN